MCCSISLRGLDIKSSCKVLICVSGTGGHLMPAKLVSLELRKRGVEPVILASGRKMDEKFFPSSEYRTLKINARGVAGKGISGILKFLLSLPSTLVQTWKIIREEKPDLIAGFGGYVTGVPTVLGKLSGIPVWLHEAEKSPGVATTVLSPFATAVSTAYQDTKIRFVKRKYFTGHPVRQELFTIPEVESEVPHKILVLGGSQGANALDECIPEALKLFRDSISVVHQCRAGNEEKVLNRYRELKIEAEVFSFIEKMYDSYSWADLVIARSGAGTVSEIAASKRPAIFIPYPFSQGDHQYFNALRLVEAGSAAIVREGEGFQERLSKEVESFFSKDRFIQLKKAASSYNENNGTLKITEGIISLIKGV